MGSFLFTQLLKYKCKKKKLKKKGEKEKEKKKKRSEKDCSWGHFFWSNVTPYWPIRRIYP